MDDRPLTEERAFTDRVVGTCRHFAVLAGAFLRHQGISARVRCGFGILCRERGADPMDFGVPGYPHAWGIAEVRGNAVRDLAALNKVEVLPWDAWGRMEASYDGQTGADYDALMDRIAETCATDDPTALVDLYAAEDLAVPAALLASGG